MERLKKLSYQEIIAQIEEGLKITFSEEITFETSTKAKYKTKTLYLSSKPIKTGFYGKMIPHKEFKKILVSCEVDCFEELRQRFPQLTVIAKSVV